MIPDEKRSNNAALIEEAEWRLARWATMPMDRWAARARDLIPQLLTALRQAEERRSQIVQRERERCLQHLTAVLAEEMEQARPVISLFSDIERRIESGEEA